MHESTFTTFLSAVSEISSINIITWHNRVVKEVLNLLSHGLDLTTSNSNSLHVHIRLQISVFILNLRVADLVNIVLDWTSGWRTKIPTLVLSSLVSVLIIIGLFWNIGKVTIHTTHELIWSHANSFNVVIPWILQSKWARNSFLSCWKPLIWQVHEPDFITGSTGRVLSGHISNNLVAIPVNSAAWEQHIVSISGSGLGSNCTS